MTYVSRKVERVSPGTLLEINSALEQYVAEVDSSDLKDDTKWTYKRHATTFVRWLSADFKPGTNSATQVTH